MEKQIKIPIENKKYIYGTLRGSLNDPLVIFVHGFTGDKEEHIFFNGSRFFESKGFSSFRFNLYHWEKDARKLEDCTLSLHAKDLDFVIDYFKGKGAKKVFVVGHSFGGLTVLLSKGQSFNAAVLWDTSIDPTLVTKGKYIKELGSFYLNSQDVNAFGQTVGKEMVDENKKLKPFELMEKFTKPVKIIAAGKGVLINGGKKYFELAKGPKDFAVISDATHNFDEDKTEEKLFQETYSWLKDFV